MKNSIYTCITNDFDTLKPGVVLQEPYQEFKDERRNSRIQKIMPHLFIDTEYSIYLDGNIEPLVAPEKLIELLGDKEIAVFKHPEREDVFQEMEAIVQLGKDTRKNIKKQFDYYKKSDYKTGLYACGVIIRKHTPEIAQLNERWWAQYCRFGVRDQLSFPVAFPKEKINIIEGSIYNHPYFKFNTHNK